MPTPPTGETLERLAAAAGPGGALTPGEGLDRYLTEWRGLFSGNTPLVLRPASTEAVAAIVAIANEAETALVPQGGNTGLVGGQIPDTDGSEVIVSLEHMNKVREVDAANNTMTVEAGCTLAACQEAAEGADRLFPLSLASEGSCQIGGNLSTNAGGTAVLRYGNARELTLGLEAVLPDGRVWHGLTGLRKDNTGYDLKDLFIGAEGTLGIITAAVVKLYPRPRVRETAFAGVADLKAAVALLSALQDASGGLVTTFEVMSRAGYALSLKHFGARDPLGGPHDWYVLAELSGGSGAQGLREAMETALMEGAADAVIAESESQRAELWALRENMSEAQKLEGASIKHDISVPVSHIPAFVDEAVAAVEKAMPGIRPVPFGHLGDGNLHFNLSQPPEMNADAFLAEWDAMNEVVHGIVAAHGGSISAEHGIGRLKREALPHYKDAVAMDLMRTIKKALDPKGIMNPGKLV